MTKKLEYEVHEREYSILDASSAMQAFFSEEFKRLAGTTLKEISEVIKDRTYYHIQIEQDRERVTRSFVRKIRTTSFNWNGEYTKFSRIVAKYEKLISLPVSRYRKKIILRLFKLNREFIPIAYVVMGGADFVHLVGKKKSKPFIKWVTKTRKRAETVFKDGEDKFIPRYTKWLANRLPGYTADDIRYIIFSEMINWLELGTPLPSPNVIRSRKEYFYIRHFSDRAIEQITGYAVESELYNRGIQLIPQVDELDSVSGQVAQVGKVTGTVKVLKKKSDIAKVESGDIIVSPMTQPNYLPAMKRAVAFVTDDGGVLCHAAIVARELNKPCVIGTKIASLIFKDGDQVEVDATKGVVRKI